MELTSNEFWRVAPEIVDAQPNGTLNPEWATPEDMAKRLAIGAGVVVGSWNHEQGLGNVHALGVVVSVDRTNKVAEVDWRPADFTLVPNPQGVAKWREMDRFRFSEDPAQRYGLRDRFADGFSQSCALTAPKVIDASPSTPLMLPEPDSQEAAERSDSPRPQRNRVTPTGDIIATAARGTFMGNRAHRVRWLVCALHFERELKEPRKYTKLFFLDEAVALSAGHRPCNTCRRVRYQAYMSAVQAEYGILNASGLDRLLNDARNRPRQRVDPSTLPDGTFVVLSRNDLRLIWNNALFKWTPDGYRESIALTDIRTPDV